MSKTGLLRLCLFLFVAAIHGIMLFRFVVYIEPSRTVPEPPLPPMRLVDIQEELPPPPPKPQEAPSAPPNPQENPAVEPAVSPVAETIAETMIVVDEAPEVQLPAVSGALTFPAAGSGPSGESETYLSQDRISREPVFSEGDIRKALIYPPVARRSRIEGLVRLELLIDREGVIRRITVLEEIPPGRGFGEAAVRAFRDQRCVPAEVNGVPVAVRYQYPVRFVLAR